MPRTDKSKLQFKSIDSMPFDMLLQLYIDIRKGKNKKVI